MKETEEAAAARRRRVRAQVERSRELLRELARGRGVAVDPPEGLRFAELLEVLERIEVELSDFCAEMVALFEAGPDSGGPETPRDPGEAGER